MRLNGRQVKQIQEALLDAYRTKDSLRMMVRVGLDLDLEAIADGANMQVVVFNLVNWAEQYGRLAELIESAREFNQNNPSLQQLTSTTIPSLTEPARTHSPLSTAPQSQITQKASIDVFLSYSRRDSEVMRHVREALRTAGLVVWTDDGLEPGTPSWRAAIEEAIKQCRTMVVLLSPNAHASVWVDNEVGFAQALDKRVYPILVAGDAVAAVPINLIRVQWIDGRQDVRDAVAHILSPALLRYIGGSLVQPNLAIELDWVMIPAGTFIMGSDARQDTHASTDDMPQHQLALARFCISRYPITNLQYSAFLSATAHPPPPQWGGQPPQGRELHPVVNVTWNDALAFCTWAGVRLPSEAQWEKAARGSDGRLFPWGSEVPDLTRCNYDRTIDDTSPVGTYPDGNSPYGVADMAGNVLEWTCSNWGSNFAYPEYGYPYVTTDGREDREAGRKMLRVVRGGAYNLSEACVRCAFRTSGNITRGRPNIGFRVVWSECD